MNHEIEAELKAAKQEIQELRAELSEVEIAHGKTAIKNQELRALLAVVRGAIRVECYCRHLTHAGPCNVCRVKQSLASDGAEELAAIRGAIKYLTFAEEYYYEVGAPGHTEIAEALAALKEYFGDVK